MLPCGLYMWAVTKYELVAAHYIWACKCCELSAAHPVGPVRVEVSMRAVLCGQESECGKCGPYNKWTVRPSSKPFSSSKCRLNLSARKVFPA